MSPPGAQSPQRAPRSRCEASGLRGRNSSRCSGDEIEGSAPCPASPWLLPELCLFLRCGHGRVGGRAWGLGPFFWDDSLWPLCRKQPRGVGGAVGGYRSNPGREAGWGKRGSVGGGGRRHLASASAAAPSAPVATGFLPTGRGTDGRAALDIVHPVRVDAGGSFLSYELWPRVLRKRDVSAQGAVPAFYELQYRGRELRFNLTANVHLLAPGFVSETRRRGGLGRTHIRARAPACHLLGQVQDPELEGGLAAISACDGLVSTRAPSRSDWPLPGGVLPLEREPEAPAGRVNTVR